MSGADYTYESQNDQRLDDLHSKIRSLRHITIDINNDAQRQNSILDDSGGIFNSFSTGLSTSANRANRAFGLNGGVKQCRIIGYSVLGFIFLWLLWKMSSWWQWSSTPDPSHL